MDSKWGSGGFGVGSEPGVLVYYTFTVRKTVREELLDDSANWLWLLTDYSLCLSYNICSSKLAFICRSLRSKTI